MGSSPWEEHGVMATGQAVRLLQAQCWALQTAAERAHEPKPSPHLEAEAVLSV